MSAHIITGWRRLAASGEVSRGPTLFFGMIVDTSAANKTCTVYACPDENEMYLFESYNCTNKGSNNFVLPNPVYFDEGLYIKLGSNVDDVLAFYSPLET